MDFVKKHYEKILLAVVLLGLVGALVMLPFMIASDRDRQEQMKEGIIHSHVARSRYWIWGGSRKFWSGCSHLIIWIFRRRTSCLIRTNGK